MRSKGLFLTLLGIVCFFSPKLMANPAQTSGADVKIADLEVKVLDTIAGQKSQGIRTLYIILYDAQSTMPMPYGAMKVDLSQDPKGTVYKGTLNGQNINIMSGGPVPETLKIKARLDKDGSAGKDSPGDFVGLAEGVKKGSKITLTIDKAVP